MAGSNHVRILDPLRGVAALMVVVFHYSGSILPSITPNALTDPLKFGKLGVQVFFVISGFIIPYAMVRSNYTWRGFPLFIARRFVRICPPSYLAMIAVILYQLVALATLGRPVNGSVWPGLGLMPVFANLTYTVEYFHTAYYNFVFWTLAVEFQFYILIALMLPLLLDIRKQWLTVLLLTLTLLPGFIDHFSYFRYASFFVLGIAAFLLREKRIGQPAFIALVVFASAAAIAQRGLPPFVASFLTMAVILSNVRWDWSPTNWLGRISYSLYIIHVPVAYWSETIMKRVINAPQHEWQRLALLVFYTSMSLLAAHLFYRFAEMPCLEWSKRIGKKKRPVGAAPAL